MSGSDDLELAIAIVCRCESALLQFRRSFIANVDSSQYKDDDGSVLGDPSNVALTQAIIELGWEPPLIRTQWDILPLVTMAEGDHPAMTEIPQDSFPLVHITHPDFELQFAKLGLRWVPAPVLSRLGFHIGGVQYTAAPFA